MQLEYGVLRFAKAFSRGEKWDYFCIPVNTEGVERKRENGIAYGIFSVKMQPL